MNVYKRNKLPYKKLQQAWLGGSLPSLVRYLMMINFSAFALYFSGVYDFIYQLSSAIDGILDISIRTAQTSQRDPL